MGVARRGLWTGCTAELADRPNRFHRSALLIGSSGVHSLSHSGQWPEYKEFKEFGDLEQHDMPDRISI